MIACDCNIKAVNYLINLGVFNSKNLICQNSKGETILHKLIYNYHSKHIDCLDEIDNFIKLFTKTYNSKQLFDYYDSNNINLLAIACINGTQIIDILIQNKIIDYNNLLNYKCKFGPDNEELSLLQIASIFDNCDLVKYLIKA